MAKILLEYKYAFLGQSIYYFAIFSYALSLCFKNISSKFLKTGSILLWICYILLTFCFAVSDFHIKTVVNFSASNTPFIYKIVAVWASPEGAFLLWVCFLSVAGFFIKSGVFKNLFSFHMLGFLLLQILKLPLFETTPLDSIQNDLNPLLQDKSMIIHPPILYFGQVIWGYLFFKIPEDPKNNFVKNLLSLGFLMTTLGIALGSYWAYYELGWGGFWYWDPVEVISLFSWMMYILCFHLFLLQKWNMFYKVSSCGWPLTLFGSCLIRSGILSSVHSFAENKDFLIFSSILFIFTVIPVFIFYHKKNPFLKENTYFLKNIISLSLWGGILVLFILTITTPLFFKNIFFSPSFYAASVWPLSLPFLLLMNHFSLKKIKNIRFLFVNSLFSTIFFVGLWIKSPLPFLAVLTLSFCLFSFLSLLFKVLNKKITPPQFLSHLGWTGMISSIIFIVFLSYEERIEFRSQNDLCETNLLSGEQIKLIGTNAFEVENYINHQITVDLITPKNKIITFKPILKYFVNTQTTHSEMNLKRDGLNERGIVIENMTNDYISLFVFQKTGIYCLWASIILMIFGIYLSIIKKINLLLTIKSYIICIIEKTKCKI